MTTEDGYHYYGERDDKNRRTWVSDLCLAAVSRAAHVRCKCGAPMKAGKVNCRSCCNKLAAENNRYFDNAARGRHEQQVADVLRLEDWDLAKDCMIVWGACAFSCAVLWALKAMTPFAFAVALALEAMAQ